MKTLILWTTVLTLLAIAGTLLATLVVSIRRERGGRKIWANFGLSLAFCAFFLVSWIAQGLAEWGSFSAEQRAR